MLIIGAVSTNMDGYQQGKVAEAYADLHQQPGRTCCVLPMQFGVRCSEQNTPPDIPDLVRVRVADGDVSGRKTINDVLAEPPPDLYPILDVLPGADAET